MSEFLKSLKFFPKIWVALTFPILIFIAMILFFGRSFDVLKITFFENLCPDFYSHISNFVLTFLIYIIIGYASLLRGITLGQLALIGVFLLALNFLIELLITTLNTPDIIDAYFGCFGVALGFLFISFTKKYGLKPNNLNNQ